MVWHHIFLYDNGGILFSDIINTVDFAVLLELVLYHSSIDFNPIALFI